MPIAKQKVLLITDAIAPYRIPVLNLIAEARAFDFTVLSLTKHMPDRNWRFDEASVKFKYKFLSSIQISMPTPNRLPVVISANTISTIKHIDPDLIIITGYYQFAFLRALLYAKKKKINVICWVESNLYTVRINNLFSYCYKKWFLNMCDNVIVPGKQSKEFLLSLGVHEKNIITAPNAVDNDYYHTDLENKYHRRSSIQGFKRYPQRNFLYVGRLIKEKGIEVLLKAYKEANLGDNIGLILVGSGRDEGYFKKLSLKLKLKNVFFEGFKQKEHLREFYRMADIFVYPSFHDEWGMVINESAVAGLPIITSDRPAASEEMVSERNGWKLKVCNDKRLGNILRNILLPEDELIKRGIESQKVAEKYSPQNCAYAILKNINQILDRKRLIVSSAGVLHTHSLASALCISKFLHNLYTPKAPSNKNNISKNRFDVMIYPSLLFEPVIKLARYFTNMSNTFVNYRNILFDRQVAVRLKKIKFDIFYGLSGSSFYSMSEAKKQEKICIVDQHDVYYKSAVKIFEEEIRQNPVTSLWGISYWPPHEGYCKRVDEELKIADYVFVPSTFSLKTYLEHDIPEEKLILMPLGIDPKIIRKKIKPRSRSEFRVGFIGSIGTRKGIKYLLDAVKDIDIPDIRTYIAGSFTAKRRILEGYDGYYKYIGYVKREKKAEFISELDTLVVPSLIDSFGFIILEAMAQGIPVIASENTGGKDIIENGKDGFIIPARDAKAIREKILFLYHNRSTRVAMGKNAIEKASSFTWTEYGKRFQNFIETIYGRNKK